MAAETPPAGNSTHRTPLRVNDPHHQSESLKREEGRIHVGCEWIAQQYIVQVAIALLELFFLLIELVIPWEENERR
jgi:hypothetical protein